MAITVIVPQAPAVANKTLIPSAVYTSSDTTTDFPVDFFSSAEVAVVVATLSGTLNVYVQKLLPDATTYDDIASFSQYTTAVYTTTGTKVLSFVNGGNTLNTQTDKSLTANTVQTVHFGSYWRVAFVLAGTGATVTFAAYGSFRV